MEWTYFAIAFIVAFPAYAIAVVQFVDYLSNAAMMLAGVIAGGLGLALLAFGAQQIIARA